REPGLLGERIEDEVAPHDRYAVGHPAAEANANETAIREYVQPLDQLVPGAETQVFIERPKPGVDAGLHVSEELIGDDAAEDQEPESDDRVEGLPRREKKHCEKDPEEQHRRTHVLFEDHHEHRDAPHGDDGYEIRNRRHREGHEAALGMRQDLAIFLEVRGEEDHEEDLHGFPRLDAPGPDLDPDPRAVDLAPDHREERGDE